MKQNISNTTFNDLHGNIDNIKTPLDNYYPILSKSKEL